MTRTQRDLIKLEETKKQLEKQQNTLNEKPKKKKSLFKKIFG